MTDVEIKNIFVLLLNLLSNLDQRRWTSMSGYTANNIITIARHHSILLSTGKLTFNNGHVEDCLVDSELSNDGYVFNARLSPSKKISMILTVSDLLSDYGMTAAIVK